MDYVFQATKEVIQNFDSDRRGGLIEDMWYFWDETGDYNGPYDSEAVAREWLDRYNKHL